MSTWISFTHVQVIATADAGGVERVNAEGGDLTTKLLDVTVFTVQRHLKVLAHLVLLRYHLRHRHKHLPQHYWVLFRVLQF